MSKIVSHAADLAGAWVSHRASAERLIGSIDQLMAPVVEKKGFLGRERIVSPAGIDTLMGDLRSASPGDARRASMQLAATTGDMHVFNGTADALAAAKTALLAQVQESVSRASLSQREADDAIAGINRSLVNDVSLRPAMPKLYKDTPSGMLIQPNASTVLYAMSDAADANLRGWVESARPVAAVGGGVEVAGNRTISAIDGRKLIRINHNDEDYVAALQAPNVSDWASSVLTDEAMQLRSELARTKPGGADALTQIDAILQRAAIRDDHNEQLADLFNASWAERVAEGGIAAESIRHGFSQATEIGHVREMLA